MWFFSIYFLHFLFRYEYFLIRYESQDEFFLLGILFDFSSMLVLRFFLLVDFPYASFSPLLLFRAGILRERMVQKSSRPYFEYPLWFPRGRKVLLFEVVLSV